MWSTLSAVGNFAYSSLEYTGLVSSQPYEQPPFACAWPNQEVKGTGEFAALTEEHYKQIQSLLDNNAWELVNYTDPEKADGGDLRLWTLPGVGRYHFIKVTLSVRNTTPQQVVSIVASDDLSVRQRFSADCIGLAELAREGDFALQHVQYWAPPPVAARDFCFLSNKRVSTDGTHCSWGCSVQSELVPEGITNQVRGACLWGWQVTPVGEHSLITYVSCMDPRGWTPSFLFSWLKTAIAKEFISMRAVVTGRAVELHHMSVEEAGISAEEIKKAEAELEAAKAQAQTQ